MNVERLARFLTHFVFVILVPLFAALGVSNLTFAQCSQQPPNGPIAVPPGYIVYYKIDSTMQNVPPGNSTPPITQIQAAFTAWSTANYQTGGIGTSFAPADAASPATVIVMADNEAPNTGADTTANAAGLITASNIATITFHPNSFITGTSSNIFQATQPGYGSVYLEAALHEIGHLMGIGEYNPVESAPAPGPNTSVVTLLRGVNDQGDAYQKSGPTNCDKLQAASASTAISAAAPGANGGSGGSTSPEPPDCSPDYYYQGPDNPDVITIGNNCMN